MIVPSDDSGGSYVFLIGYLLAIVPILCLALWIPMLVRLMVLMVLKSKDEI